MYLIVRSLDGDFYRIVYVIVVPRRVIFIVGSQLLLFVTQIKQPRETKKLKLNALKERTRNIAGSFFIGCWNIL